MNQIIKISDKNELVPTNKFPNYAKFPFENFNPVQSSVFDFYDQDVNAVIASSTSSGKTVCAEMFLSHEVRVRGGKGLFLAPMKALAKEKIDDWTEAGHHFNDLKIAICTGDYRLTAERKKELDEADLIIMTNEMLSARIRNYKSEVNTFLDKIGTLVSDEYHLLGTSRGDHAEIGLMNFAKLNPNCRIVGLSATLPNVDEISSWMHYALNRKKTYCLVSKYRPCPLGVHYELYEDVGKYEQQEMQKISSAIKVIQDYPDDIFLVFAHTKNTGKLLEKELKKLKYKVEFHNADLNKEERHDLENRFRDRKLDVLIATSTLAWGCNLPARRVIILGIHRGLAEVDNFDITQEVGRAGRPKYDKRGDAVILVPESESERHIKRLSTPQRIESKLLEYIGDEKNPQYKTLAFHLTAAIHGGEVQTRDDIHQWYQLTLANFQSNKLEEDIIDATLDSLVKCGAIRLYDGKYEVTVIGKISSLFYYSPFDTADLKKNFSALFDGNYQDNDLMLSFCLGNVDTNRLNFVSKAEKAEMGHFSKRIRDIFGNVMESAIKGAYCYHLLLNGFDLGIFANMARNLQFDFDRTRMVLEALDGMTGKWKRKDWFKTLGMRIQYGVQSHLIDLCRIEGVGKVRAERLYAAGLTSYSQIANNPDHVSKVLNMKDVKTICDHARILGMV